MPLLALTGLVLVSETFGYDHDLIFAALRNAQGEFTARISIGLPAELLFAGAADTNAGAGQGVGFVGEDGADDEKIVGVALAALAAGTEEEFDDDCVGRGRRRR